jgi:adenylate cyclase class 2
MSSSSPSAQDELVEVEVKFLVGDLAIIRQRLAALGARMVAPRVFERNVRFDTPDEALLRRQQLLRLRQDNRARLTFKGPSAADASSEAKVREEIELEIGDFDRMALIFSRLGFQPFQTYEKYRETFAWGEVEVVLDEMPFGLFVELEGPEAKIKQVAGALGLEWSKRVLTNYLAMMGLVREKFSLPFTDLTFANFAQRPVDLGELFPRCL